MKKYVLIVMAALAFAACTKNELKVQPEAISFQTIVGQHGTRAMINGTEYPTSESFGSAAFLAETGDVYMAHA